MIVVPTLHPMFLARKRGDESGGGLSKFQQTVIGDIAKAVRLTQSLSTWDESAIWQREAQNTQGAGGGVSDGRLVALFPTLAEVHAFVAAAQGTTLAIDVETTGESPLACQLICVGIASTNGRVLCVPFLKQGGDSYWGPNTEQVRAQLAWLFADPGTKKVFHNGAFDTTVLWAQGMPVTGWEFDTMVAHHVVDSELPHGLGYVSSIYLDSRYWKDDVKGAGGWLQLPDITLRGYNLRDSLSTIRICPGLGARLDEYSLWSLFWEELELNKLFVRATIRGLAVDFKRRDDPTPGKDGKPIGLGPRMRGQSAHALSFLRQVLPTGSDGRQFDPQKPVHLRELLFQTLKLPVVLKTKSGIPATNKDALVLLALASDTQLQRDCLKALIDFRQGEKFNSTFVEGLPVLGDGRFHPTWKLLTTTGRFASTPNAQTFNKAVKKMFRAGPGMKLVGVDLSQAEMRFMAYLSNDEELLRMYREGINVHTVNATLLFQVKCPASKTDHINPQTEAYLREMVPRLLGSKYDYDKFPEMPKDKWPTTRTLSKVFAFAANYGAIAETIYTQLRSKRDPETNNLLFPDLELSQVEAMRDLWFKLHPAIARWHRDIQAHVKRQGFYKCPISGRRQWYRAGFKQTEMLNRPIQSGIASWVNRCTLEIQRIFDTETNGAAQLVQQVHDALNAEVPPEYAQRAGEVMMQVLGRKFRLINHEVAELPADPFTIGEYLDEV